MRLNKSSIERVSMLAILVLAVVALATRAAAQQETVLYSFGATNVDADGPFGSLIFDASGNLYGTTVAGGTYGLGTAFELSPNSDGGWTETILHSFGSGSDGSYPESALIMDALGRLYGTTNNGGASNYGTVFALAPTKAGGWQEKILHSFGGKDGQNPFASLIFDKAGNLYGTTGAGGAYGYGTVFELVAAKGGFSGEKVLHSFNANGIDGQGPSAALVFDAAGNLYGTTLGGGTATTGTAYELLPSASGAWKEKILYNFAFGAGQVPVSTLIFDGAGDLYGTTRWGGLARSAAGTVFELSPTSAGGWKHTLLHSFGDGTDGQNPEAGVVIDSAGNLYGTTEVGGSYSNGTVFELSPAGGGTWTESVLHNFYSSGFADGGYPWSGLILDSPGTLFGTASAGGALNTGGIVFEITP